MRDYNKMELLMTYATIYNDPWRRSVITETWTYWDNGFTNEELKRIEDYCDSQGTELGTTGGAGSESTPETVGQHRVSDVKFHHRNAETSWFFDKINHYVQATNESYYNFNLNGFSTFQYTTYTAEQQGRYDWHTDMIFSSHYRDEFQTRKLSITLLLNDDFEGGEFQINIGKESNPTIVPVPKGRAIFFPSFLLHRVTSITKGIRKSIVVWVLGPKFT